MEYYLPLRGGNGNAHTPVHGRLITPGRGLILEADSPAYTTDRHPLGCLTHEQSALDARAVSGTLKRAFRGAAACLGPPKTKNKKGVAPRNRRNHVKTHRNRKKQQ